MLDLGSGSGEMLCTWGHDHGVVGTGVDMSELFAEQEKRRAEELGVADRVELIHGGAAGFVARGCLAGSISDILLLPDLLASFGRLGYDVVEMVLVDQYGWDRYEAARWLTMRRWLEDNPEDELANDVRARMASDPERYAAYTRECLGWGVFAPMTP